MNICFLTNTPFEIGGVERVLTVLANELVKNNNVTILCTKLKEENYSLYNLDKRVKLRYIKNLKTKKYNYPIHKTIKKINGKFQIKNIAVLTEAYWPLREREKYKEALQKEEYDVIVAVQDNFSLLLAIIARNLKAKCFGWFHNSYEAYFETKGKYSWHQKNLFKKYIKNLEGCIALTNSDVHSFNKNIVENFKTIYNPITCDVSKTSELNNKIVLFVGRLVKQQKGLDYLVEIAKKVKNSNNNIKFIVVGDGPDRRELEEMVSKESLNNVLVLKGATNDVSHYYSSADLVINTSRWEGFGLVITEALAHGVPVVAFETEGPKEIILDKECGFLVKKFDTDMFAQYVLNILIDQKLRLKLGSNSINRSKEFSVEKTVVKWMQLFNK